MIDHLLRCLNYLPCVVASAVFLNLLFARRELLIKPSMQILFYTHIFIQWPFVVRQTWVENVLPYPADAALLIHGFVLVGLAVSLVTWRTYALELFSRVTTTGANYIIGAMPYVVALLVLSTVAVAIYIREVPLSRTGLVVAVVDPDLAGAAREESLKLVESSLVRYGFSLLSSTLAPVTAVFLFGLIAVAIRKRLILQPIAWLVILIALVLVASLTGARMFAVLILFAILVSAVLRRGFRINPLSASIGALVIITPPVVLTLLREGLVTDFGLLPEYYWNLIRHRVFGSPLEIGVYYMHFEQVFGPIGISGIPRLAEIVGVPAVNVPNQIGLMYVSTPILSVSANAGFLFAFYAYFGIIALPICLAALWSLDLTFVLLARLDVQLLLPTLAAMAATGLSFVSSDFTVTLLSHGYGLIPIVAFALVVSRRIASKDLRRIRGVT